MRSVILGAVAVIIAVAGQPASAAPGDYSVLRSFPAPQVSPDGLEWDGQYLWSTECQSQTNYKLDPVTGQTVSQGESTGIMVDHFAWDGASMWGTHAHTNMVHRFDSTGSQSLDMYSAPTTVMGIAWDGASFWVVDPDGKQIYPWQPGQTGVATSFQTPGNNPCGLGWDGQCLWASDLTTQRFYALDPATGDVVLSIDSPGGPGRLPTGFTWDGEYAWVADEDPGNPTIYQLDIEFPTDGPCGREATTAGAIDSYCTCDATTACDPDGGNECACDPECIDDSGCAAVPPTLWVLTLPAIAAVAWTRRRRRSGASIRA